MTSPIPKESSANLATSLRLDSTRSPESPPLSLPTFPASHPPPPPPRQLQLDRPTARHLRLPRRHERPQSGPHLPKAMLDHAKKDSGKRHSITACASRTTTVLPPPLPPGGAAPRSQPSSLTPSAASTFARTIQTHPPTPFPSPMNPTYLPPPRHRHHG